MAASRTPPLVLARPTSSAARCLSRGENRDDARWHCCEPVTGFGAESDLHFTLSVPP
jgi:hypothetical protein